MGRPIEIGFQNPVADMVVAPHFVGSHIGWDVSFIISAGFGVLQTRRITGIGTC